MSELRCIWKEAVRQTRGMMIPRCSTIPQSTFLYRYEWVPKTGSKLDAEYSPDNFSGQYASGRTTPPRLK